MLFAKLKYFVALFFLVNSSIASAGLIVPSGIQPGQQYRLVFVTSGKTTATSSDISYYNNFVTTQAGLVSGLNATTWNAIASTLTVAARDNTGTNPTDPNHVSVPIYLLNGTLVATGNSDLWDGSLASPISISDAGQTFIGGVWTGSDAAGLQFNQGLGGLPTDRRIGFGLAGATNSLWISASTLTQGNLLRLYGISGVITAVPEPSSLLMVGLVGIGTCGWSLSRLRRKTNS